MNLGQLVTDALDLVFPPRCQVCGLFSRELLCDACRASVSPIAPPMCRTCGRAFDPKSSTIQPGADLPLCGECRLDTFDFDLARSAAAHTGTLRKAIIAFKFHGRRRLARPLGDMLAGLVREPPPGAEALAPCPADMPSRGVPPTGIVVPVPLHDRRERWRGYNQAVLLAEPVAAAARRPLRPDVLVRSRETEPQVDLTAAQRRRNVRGAFDVALTDAVVGRAVLLIDDVFTTGNTLSECARVLKRAGAAHVACLTLSRSTPDWDRDRDLF